MKLKTTHIFFAYLFVSISLLSTFNPPPFLFTFSLFALPILVLSQIIASDTNANFFIFKKYKLGFFTINLVELINILIFTPTAFFLIAIFYSSISSSYFDYDILIIVLYNSTILVQAAVCLHVLYNKNKYILKNEILLKSKVIFIFFLYIIINYFLGSFYKNKIIQLENDMDQLSSLAFFASCSFSVIDFISNFRHELF